MQSPAPDTTAPDLSQKPLQRLLDFLDTYRVWVFIAIGLFYLVGFNGLHRIGDDSSLYLAIGKNIAAGEGYTYHGEPESLAMPLVPYVLGVCLKMSPAYGVSIALGVLLLGGLATLAMAYQLFRLFVPRATAVLALVFLASNNQVHGVQYRLLTDAPYLLGVMATFLGYTLLTRAPADDARPTAGAGWVQTGLAWCLFFIGLAVATTSRIVMLALLLALGAACVWGCIKHPREVRRYLLAAGGLSVLVAFYLLDPRRSTTPGATQAQTYESGLMRRLNDFGDTLYRVLTEFVPSLMDPSAVEGTFGFDPSMPIAWVLSILALAMGVIGCGKRPLWVGFLVANLGMLLVFGSAPRYFIPIAFIIHLGGAMMVVWFAKSGGRHPRFWGYAGLGLVLMTVLPNVGVSLGFLIEQRSRDFYQTYDDGKYAELVQTVRALERELPGDAVILSDRARVLTCYSRYDVLTAEEVIKRRGGEQALPGLRERGELYVLLPGDERMEELLARPGVHVGPEIATVPHWTIDEPPLSLRRITYAAEEGSSGP